MRFLGSGSRGSWWVAVSSMATVGIFVTTGLCAESPRLSFNHDVRPILSAHCYACHGFDEHERKAGLRLDVPEGAATDLGGYVAILPGQPEASAVWKRITAQDHEDVMPPPEFHKPLTDEQKDILRRWIEQGADYEPHWAFVAPQAPAVPAIEGVDHPIDRFLQAKLRQEGISPAPEAPKETQIRRVTLDLTGLPPTPAEVDAFLQDASPKAYEELVRELLGRVGYGEHMARYWLDLARYADTHGLHLDNERSMWPYRDWVVRAFNENLPFDDFTRWQLAGDLLEDPSRDQLIASGFNRCNVTTSEGGSINEEWIYRYAVDRTNTAVEVWMGLTASCAVCHDHKFDPLTTKEYYSMYAFFNSAADPAMDGNQIATPPILRLTTPEEEAQLAEIASGIARVEARIVELVAGMSYEDPSTMDPPPAPREVESIWFEDGFPSGTQPQAAGAPLTLVHRDEGEVFSGQLALQRTAYNEVAQDSFSGGAEWVVPEDGTFFVHCYLDPANPPQSIMLQFHAGGWKHRAVWGDADKIPFGRPGTAEKVVMGPLPPAGSWARLEIPAEQLALKPGTKVTGYAFTQFGGTVSWDKLGVLSVTDMAKSPSWSWKIWKEQHQRRAVEALPPALRKTVRDKASGAWTAEETEAIFRFWLGRFYEGNRDLLLPVEGEKIALLSQKTAIEKSAPITLIMADLPQPRESFVMQRGLYDSPGEKVGRNVPAFLPSLPRKPDGQDYHRLDLAHWLVDGKHPLTARVTVNRLWQQFFGWGLVTTSEDFGLQGAPPSHPELLDWLAVQFVEDGWDIKRLVSRIVTSHAYRQSSVVSAELLQRDPENRLLSRGPRHRLDAEVLRDQALYVSGLLVNTVGGKSVKPYQPPNIWEPVGYGDSNTRYYKQDSGPALYRRSLYTFLKRTAPPPFLASFDAPNREMSCSRRGRSNTPMQALQLMNDIQHVEAARLFGQRILQQGGNTEASRLRWAWRTVTARWPESDEVEILLGALRQHRARFASDEKAAADLIAYGESPADASLSPTELAAWTMIANLLLNLDETVVKN